MNKAEEKIEEIRREDLKTIYKLINSLAIKQAITLAFWTVNMGAMGYFFVKIGQIVESLAAVTAKLSLLH
jgi:hypothetical protein